MMMVIEVCKLKVLWVEFSNLHGLQLLPEDGKLMLLLIPYFSAALMLLPSSADNKTIRASTGTACNYHKLKIGLSVSVKDSSPCMRERQRESKKLEPGACRVHCDMAQLTDGKEQRSFQSLEKRLTMLPSNVCWVLLLSCTLSLSLSLSACRDLVRVLCSKREAQESWRFPH
jgi:hypothetical protein